VTTFLREVLPALLPQAEQSITDCLLEIRKREDA
jgi:hypothetical protein